MSDDRKFSYEEAFSRNIGWVTEWEQSALRGRCVAVAGMGGVGGIHLLTLARLGVGRFRIADFDVFDLVNFNRQAGATMDTLGRPKLDVMAEMALAINPELAIARFPEGVTPGNLDDFLAGADAFIDGFDFFALPIRRLVFARCAQLGIPALTAAPIGMGTGFLAFVPGGMTFEQYFRLEGLPENEQYLRFLMGVAPRGLHRSYLVDPSRIDLAAKKGPSTAAACQLCAGVVAVMALRLLLQRGGIKAAPFHHHFDAYAGRYDISKLPQGNAGLLQRARLALARRAFAAPRPSAANPEAPASSTVAQILTAARWAPSGDNSQPWRFEAVGEDAVRIHVTTEAGTNPYDYRSGEPSLLSAGMLLESLRIAASQHGRAMEWQLSCEGEPCCILARFPSDPEVRRDALGDVLAHRSVDRRPYLTRPLTAGERDALALALGTELTVTWHEPTKARLAMARLGALATDIRLRAPETFAVHRRVIDWNKGHSPTGLAAGSIGLDRGTLAVMKWAMRSWSRVQWLNRVSGTWTAALQLDIAPGLKSAAFFVLSAEKPHAGTRVEQLLRRGQAIQRFWLTAASLGLALQPGLAILIFAHYGAHDIKFTGDTALLSKAQGLSRRFGQVVGQATEDVVFLGRIGEPKPGLPKVRSTRRTLDEMQKDAQSPRVPRVAVS